MNGRKILLFGAAALILIFAGYVVSMEKAQGVVVKIEGSSLSIMDGVGQMVTLSGHDPKEFENIKVGDKVVIKDGVVFKDLQMASARTYPNYMHEVNRENISVFP